MKRYGIYLLLFMILAVVCFGAGYVMSAARGQEGTAISNTTFSTEEVTEDRIVINQRLVEPAQELPMENYFLVSETGYLLVFAQDQSTICLYTHIPITDFPEKEQDRLRAGIWFPSMIEIFHYLESYTS